MCARISEDTAPQAAEWAEQRLCASTRADGCRPSEADSEPRVVVEFSAVATSTHRSSSKKSLASTETRKPSSGLQRSLEAGRRGGGSGGGGEVHSGRQGTWHMTRAHYPNKNNTTDQ